MVAPLIPFALGAVAGALTLNWMRKEGRTRRVREGLDKAQDKLREATASGLGVIEEVSAKARHRLGDVQMTAPPPVAKRAPRKRVAARDKKA